MKHVSKMDKEELIKFILFNLLCSFYHRVLPEDCNFSNTGNLK